MDNQILEGEKVPIIEVENNSTYRCTAETIGEVQLVHLIQRGKILGANLDKFADAFVNKVNPERKVFLAFEATKIDTNIMLIKDLIFKSEPFRRFFRLLGEWDVQILSVDTEDKFGSAAMHIFACTIAEFNSDIPSPIRVGNMEIARELVQDSK